MSTDELNSAKNSSRAFDVMLPLETCWMSYSEISPAQDNIILAKIWLLQDFVDKIVSIHKDVVTLKVWSQFPCGNDEGQCQLLNILIAILRASEHLDYEIHESLFVVYLLDKERAQHMFVTERQRSSGDFSFRRVMTGGDLRKSFTLVKDSSHLMVHLNLSFLFKAAKKTRALSPAQE